MEGWQFAAELSHLRIVGRVDLPELSFTYASMNQALNSTAAGEAAAFQAPGGGVAASRAGWAELRDDLQNIFGQTSTHLIDAGVVVEHVVDAYVASDEGARTGLEAAWATGPPPGLYEDEEEYTRDTLPVVIKGEDV
jgi:hypothetical protein